MKLTEIQRVAICRVLLDALDEMHDGVLLQDIRHYQQLQQSAHITEEDLLLARKTSVLSSLVILKEIPYNLKMLLGLTVYEIFSAFATIPIKQRIAFELLMSAIDWPISFSEISSIIK